MTIEQIARRVQDIKKTAVNAERAHSMENSLYHDFISYIAEGGDNHLQLKAREILKTKEIYFPRWCA